MTSNPKPGFRVPIPPPLIVKLTFVTLVQTQQFYIHSKNLPPKKKYLLSFGTRRSSKKIEECRCIMIVQCTSNPDWCWWSAQHTHTVYVYAEFKLKIAKYRVLRRITNGQMIACRRVKFDLVIRSKLEISYLSASR